MQSLENWNRNKKFLPNELIDQIESLNESPTLGEILYNKQNLPILRINDILFHSQHDPIKEARRLLESLKQTETEKLYIFFGAGLGYIILEALKSPKLTVIWMEQTLSILRFALNVFDFSEALKSQRLKILTPPFHEEKLYTAFKGLGNLPTTFIPHKPSFQWKFDDYNELKLICEKFFHKKNANIATLSKFEGVWTRNIFQNLPFLFKMKPVSLLFNIAKEIPILVVGAGPSLYYDLGKIKQFRNYFLIIVVDTAFHILKQAKIEPDLIYTVDPQVINKNYLEPYNGEGFLVFDPTCNYHTLRLHPKLQQGFFSSSPFPLFQIFSKFCEVPVGDIPFGGSVSTNAASLAEKLGASHVLLIGQDLAFTDGFAHCKGAILEERLNFKESRKFRRETHNHRQRFALQKILVKGYDGKNYHTNEKMEIFRKWFSENGKEKNWINLTSKGSVIPNLPKMNLEAYIQSLSSQTPEKVSLVRKEIQKIFFDKKTYFNIPSLQTEISKLQKELEEFSKPLHEGLKLSNQIYQLILSKKQYTPEFSQLIKKMETIDERVSQKRGLNELLSLGLQRTILMITEGYDSSLSLEEKKNFELGVAKKSVLLYEGLYNLSCLMIRLMKKLEIRLEKSYEL